jgi:GNAT superfamily N-acetyltransferase
MARPPEALMRIIEHDEITSELEADLQLLRASVGLPPRDFSLLRQAQKVGYPSTDYFGLYAVEGNHILSTLRVLRLPYTFPDGHEECVSAILSVMTRADCRGRGLVRGLLEETHKRERRAGSRFSILWCDRSIRAHGLYEYMGYRDVYFPDFATTKPARSKKAACDLHYSLKTVDGSDVSRIGRIHTLATEGRIGFTPRPHSYLESLIKYGLFAPESFRLIIRDGRPVGYLELQDGPTAVKVSEVVMLPESLVNPSDLLLVLEHFCSEEENRWLWLSNTYVRDSKEVLVERRYSVSSLNNHVLMSLPLDGSSSQNQIDALGVDDSRFVCHITDYF